MKINMKITLLILLYLIVVVVFIEEGECRRGRRRANKRRRQRQRAVVSPASIQQQRALFPPPGTEATAVCTVDNGGSDCSLWSTPPLWQSFEEVDEQVNGYDSPAVNRHFKTLDGARARLATDYLYPKKTRLQATGICVSFAYKIRGTAATTLTLYEQPLGSQIENIVWRITGANATRQDQWQVRTSQITSRNPVKITLVAQSNEGNGYVALDDIGLFNTTCYIQSGDNTKPYQGASRSMGVSEKPILWQNGRIAYELTTAFNETQTRMINAVFTEIAAETCVSFVKRTNELDYIKFVNLMSDETCISNLGKTGGIQMMMLSEMCFTHHLLSHMILHAIGLRHEHVRSDRDQYVQVKLENIETNNRVFFVKRPRGVDTEVDTIPYDKQSVMHFKREQLARPGTFSIVSKASRQELLGNTQGPRDSDFEKVKALYSCAEHIPISMTTTPELVNDSNQPCIEIKTQTGRSGEIMNDLNDYGTYRNGENCRWKIVVRRGQAVEIEFVYVDIPSSNSFCENSFVSIYDGDSERANIMAKVCGFEQPTRKFVSSGNSAFVKFSTSDSDGVGFQLAWRAVAASNHGSNEDEGDSDEGASIDCNFDSGTCGWRDASTMIHWQRQLVPSISRTDHTSGTRRGRYMSVQAIRIAGIKKEVRIKSPQFQASQSYRCFSFWYRMADDGLSQNINLEVLASRSSSSQEISLWSADQIIGDQTAAYSSWQKALVPLNALTGSSPYRLTIKATIERKMIGGVAVDDASISYDTCPIDYDDENSDEIPNDIPDDDNSPSSTCDFEGSLCGWVVSHRMVDTNWTRKSGTSSPGSSYGPTEDHSRGTRNGQYLVVNSSPNQKGVARAEKSVESGEQYKCFQFWYMMNGRHLGKLTVSVIPLSGSLRGDEIAIFMASGNKPKKWQQSSVSLEGLSGAYRLRIDAQVTGYSDGDIAIDDLAFFTTACSRDNSDSQPPSYSPVSNLYFCDFEDDNLCQDTLQFRDRSRHRSFEWKSLQPGDVRGLRGHFVGARGGRTGREAKMVTRSFLANEHNCMTFWYYLGSRNTQLTSLVLHLVVNGRQSTQLFRTTSSRVNRGSWLSPQVTIPRTSEEFKIQFTAKSGGSTSLILVDDVALSKNDKCRQLSRTMMVGGSNNRPSRRQLASRRAHLDCRFGDGDFCSWTSNRGWKVVTTSADQDIAGPDDRFAHVSSGRLVVQEGNSRGLPSAEMTSNVTATLTSQIVRGVPKSCLRFFYKIGGWFRDLPMDTLNVYVRNGRSSGSPRRLIASLSGTMSPSEMVDKWLEAKLTIYESDDFQIIFQAMTGDSWVGSVAIDDIQFKPTLCPEATFDFTYF